MSSPLFEKPNKIKCKFIRQKVYQRYAEQFLDANQIDCVDESGIPGYTP